MDSRYPIIQKQFDNACDAVKDAEADINKIMECLATVNNELFIALAKLRDAHQAKYDARIQMERLSGQT